METKNRENISIRKEICWVGPQKWVGHQWETIYFMVPNE